MFKQLIHFLQKGIWKLQPEKMPWWRAAWIRTLRMGMIVSHGFTKSQIQMGASTLTYYTLLALVPLVALFVAVAKAFLLEDRLKQWMVARFSEHEEILTYVIKFAESSLEQAQQGIIAGVGIILLLWAGLKILIQIEQVMNQIWEVPVGRSLTRRFSDYLALIFICPIIILLLSGVAAYVSTALTAIGKEKFFFHEIWPLLAFLISIFPYVLTWFILTFLYIYMPNTRVKFLPAFFSALVTGTIFQIFQWIYVRFQIGVSSHNAVYGTFAALPLFLIWTHLSWVILLMGAKISFAFQNLKGYQFISEDIELKNSLRTLLAVRIAHLCVKQFLKDDPSLSAIEISNKLSIPLPLTNLLLHKLVDCTILAEVRREKDQDLVYQPARSIENLTIKRVIDMMDDLGEEIPVPSSHETRLILKSLNDFDSLIEKSKANLLLKNI